MRPSHRMHKLITKSHYIRYLQTGAKSSIGMPGVNVLGFGDFCIAVADL